MANTTSGEKAATRTASRRGAAASTPTHSGKGTKIASKRIGETENVPASAGKRASPKWTLAQAREILSQAVIEATEAGLNVRVYETTRGTVVIELMAHRIDDGVIVPATTKP